MSDSTYTIGGTTFEVFSTVGAFSWTPPAGVVSYSRMLQAGGGGGGRHANGAGGGGAGANRVDTGLSCTPGTPITGTVGAGGAVQTVTSTNGNAGSDTTMGGTTALGGAGGGGTGATAPSGGSGGGGIGGGAGSNFAGGTGVSGEGHGGGAGFGSATINFRAAGGGGGAGTVGGNAVSTDGGAGGSGVDRSALVGTGVGVAGLFGGGGGGGCRAGAGSGGTRGPAGSGGGGIGGISGGVGGVGGNGVAGTGGGGGGGGGNDTSSETNGGSGGSGLVIVWYAPVAAPGVPTNVAETHSGVSIAMTWDPPATGGTPTGYQVRLNGGTPVAVAVENYTFTGLTPSTPYTVEVRAENSGGSSSWVLLNVTTLGPPGDPTGVASPSQTATTIQLTWVAPVGGDPVDGYELSPNGGFGPWTDVGNVLAGSLTGLTPDTSYDPAVRAYSTGGNSNAVGLLGISTLPAPLYSVGVTVTPPTTDHLPITWETFYGEPADYGIRLPLSLGWSIPDAVEFFPASPDPLPQLVFSVLVPTADEVVGLVRGSSVHLELFNDPDPLAEPWQHFDGVVTQVDGETTDAGDFLATVYAADDVLRLDSVQVGYTADWPQESIADRVDRICTEVGITHAWFETDGTGGEVPARAGGKPTSALSALRDTLKDLAIRYTSEGPTYYGRPVMRLTVDPLGVDPAHLSIVAFLRRVLPGITTTLDGDLVHAQGRWQRRPGVDAATWGIVDTAVFGTPDGTPPFVRSTGLVAGVPGNPTRGYLGNSLLSGASTELAGWYHKLLRYEASDSLEAAELVSSWVSTSDTYDTPWWFVHPVVVEEVDPRYQLNGLDYLAGTLTGARLVIPPGGAYYLELQLRSELLDGTDLPA